jgi:hypothetical protein
MSTIAGHEELCEAVFEMLVSEGLVPHGEVIARFDMAPIIATGIVRELEGRLAISERAGKMMAERIAALLDVAEAAQKMRRAMTNPDSTHSHTPNCAACNLNRALVALDQLNPQDHSSE